MDEEIELELYYLKNIIDLINSLNLEFFNIICLHLNMKIIKRLCNNPKILPVIRKALVCLYTKYYLGNYFRISVIDPGNINEVLNFDLVIESKDEKVKREIQLSENDEFSDDNAASDEDGIVKLEENKESELDNKTNKDNYMNSQNLKKFELEKECYDLIIENLQKFPLIFNELKNLSRLKIQKNIYNYFIHAIYEPTYFAVFRIIIYPKITKEMNLILIKLIAYYIKCYHLFLITIRDEFLSVKENNEKCIKLFNTYLNIESDDYSRIDKENVDENNFSTKLERIIKIVEDKTIELDNEYIYNNDLQKMLEFYKHLVKHVNKSYSEKSESIRTPFKILLSKIKNYYHQKKKSSNENVIYNIFKDNEGNDTIKKHIFYSLFREINLKKGVGLIFEEPEKRSNSDNQIKKSIKSVNENMKKYSAPTLNKNNPFRHKTLQERKINFVEEEGKFSKPSKNIIIFKCINMLIKIQPAFCQKILREVVKNKHFFEVLIKQKFVYLFQMCINNFKVIDDSKKNLNLILLKELIEFLRLLCEDHNKNFQSFIINYKYSFPNGESLSLVSIVLNHLTKILNNIQYYAQKENLLIFLKISKKNYFHEILNKLTDFLIEMIQGTYSHNFDKDLVNTKNQFFQVYLEKIKLIMNDYESTGEDDYEPILTNFFLFGISFLDEESNKLPNKKRFLKLFNMNQLMNILIFLMKKFYFLLKNENGISYLKDLSPYRYKEVINEVNYSDNGYQELREYYMKTEYSNMKNSLYLSLKIYNFIKLSVNFDNKFSQIINEFEYCKQLSASKKELNSREKNLDQIYKFFKLIIHEVEVTHFYDLDSHFKEFDLYRKFFQYNDNTSVHEKIKDSFKIKKTEFPVKRVFTICNLSMFTEARDIEREIVTRAYDQKSKKLSFLMDSIPDLKDYLSTKIEIHYNYMYIEKILTIEAEDVIKYSSIFIVFINVLLAFSLYITPENTISANLDYHTTYLSLIHIILISIYVCALNFFNFIKLKKFKHIRLKNLSNKEAFNDYITALLHPINLKLYWILIFGILALCGGTFRVFYSVQLITIFYLSSTMSSAMKTFKLKYTQFAASILIIILVSLLFASLGYNYYNNLYYREDLQYNMCDSYFHCFLTIFGWGFINGSVDFANIKSIKDPTYWDHFAFSWMYYFLISIIMVNIINAIIVDAFQDIRIETNERYESMHNTCFICTLEREKFQIKGIDFDHHKTMEHNVEDYIHYLIKLNEMDMKNLNSIDAYSKDCFENKKINFFPIGKAISISSKK